MADKKQSREVEFNGKKIVSCRKDGHPCCFDECEIDIEKPSKQSDLTVKVTADVGEALTGFKALQRELRESTKAAREMEQACKDVEKAIAPTVPELQTHALIDAVKSEASIPDKLRESILAKFAEDEAKIVELEGREPKYRPCKPNTSDLSEVSTEDLSEELAEREGVTCHYVAPHGAHAELWLRDANSGVKHYIDGPAIIMVNKD